MGALMDKPIVETDAESLCRKRRRHFWIERGKLVVCRDCGAPLPPAEGPDPAGPLPGSRRRGD